MQMMPSFQQDLTFWHIHKCAVCLLIIVCPSLAIWSLRQDCAVQYVGHTPVENQDIMTFQTKKQGCKLRPWSCRSLFGFLTGQWCLAWWCFGGAGQLAVMTWCCPPSSFFYCTASGESAFLSLYLIFLYVFHFEFIGTSLAFILRLVVLSVVLFGLPYGSDQSCSETLVDHGRGYLGILVSCLICESAIMWLSMRGSILYTQPREAVQYVLYIRLGKTRRHLKQGYLLMLMRIGGRWLSGLLVVSKLRLYWLGRYWSLLSPLPLPPSLSSYPVGRARICCGGNCLACPVLSAMLWCHCQKSGFGCVKEDIKENGKF